MTVRGLHLLTVSLKKGTTRMDAVVSQATVLKNFTFAPGVTPGDYKIILAKPNGSTIFQVVSYASAPEPVQASFNGLLPGSHTVTVQFRNSLGSVLEQTQQVFVVPEPPPQEIQVRGLGELTVSLA